MPQPARVLVSLNDDWRFLPDPDGLGEAKGWYKNALSVHARPIQVPHTWSVDDDTESFVGRGWYSRTLTVPTEWAHKLIRLHFGAVYRDAVVWINGARAADHYGSGYTPFDVDATPHLRPGETNLLVVAVDNSFSHTALPYLRHFDWANDGGIIRPVRAVVSGSPAVAVARVTATPTLTGPGSAIGGRVGVRVELTGETELADLRVRLAISGPEEGHPVWEDERPVAVRDGAFTIDGIALPDVRLWHFDHPHLYTLRLSLTHAGEETDAVETRFGFREVRVAGPRILLNGEPVRLMGVEWMPGSDPAVGMAEDDARIDATLRAMKDANCVLTRFHWQQDERVLDWCDRHGMLVQEEVPLWGSPKEPGEAAMTVARRQAQEMIRWHGSHPSIIAWGMANELDGQSPVTRQAMTDFRTFIRELDDTRLVNYVSNTFHKDPARDATVAGDVLMWNGYAGTWLPDLDLVETLDRIATALPDRPLVISEFGLCEPALPGGDPRRIAMLREQMPPIGACRTVTGAIYFSLNDYRTHMGEEGDGRHRRRVHGVTDLVGQPKPSYAVLRELSAPLRVIEARRVSPTEIELAVAANRPKEFPSYRLVGYCVMVSAVEETLSDRTEVALPDLDPGDRATVAIADGGRAAGQLRVCISRPDGGTAIDIVVPIGEGAA